MSMNLIAVCLGKQRFLMIKRSVPFLLVILLGFICSLQAQQITGSLEGRVLDPDGKPLAEVNVIIRGSSLQGTRGTTSYSQASNPIAHPEFHKMAIL